MGYVATAAELERFRRTADFAAGVTYAVDVLSVAFTTTPAFVRSVLPPCLEPASGPTGVVSVGAFRKHVRGRPGRGPGVEFEHGVIGVHARVGDREGLYPLTTVVSGDMPVTIGREVAGEVKKRGRLRLLRDGERAYAFIERHGVRLAELEARLGPDLGPAETASRTFELRAALAADAAGLRGAPVLVELASAQRLRDRREGEARLRLAGTAVDPVDTIPLVATGGATLAAGTATVAIAGETVLEWADAYLAYVVGRAYDDVAAWEAGDAASGAPSPRSA